MAIGKSDKAFKAKSRSRYFILVQGQGLGARADMSTGPARIPSHPRGRPPFLTPSPLTSGLPLPRLLSTRRSAWTQGTAPPKGSGPQTRSGES